MEKLSPDQFAETIKTKYPQYKEVDNATLTSKMLAKYPEYSDRVDSSATGALPTKPKSLGQKILGGAQKVSDFLGGKGVTDLVGGAIAKATVPKEQREFVDMPSTKEVAGSALQLGSLFIPVGTAAKVATTGLKAAKIPLANLGGKVAAGAGTGYTMDVGADMQQDKTLKETLTPGVATAIGGGLPLVAPVARGLGKVTTDALGKTTGIGGGALQETFGAARAGGKKAQAFADAYTGKTSPDKVVENARESLGTIIGNRTKEYQTQLSKLKTNKKTFDHTPVVQKFNKMLDEFGVAQNADGTPNFLRSPGLGRYEKDLKQLSQVLKDWGSAPGDRTVVGIDKLKQVIDDFRIGSQDSKKFDSFVTALRNEAKGLIKGEPGYDNLVKGYEESTGLIKEIQKGLSLGDKAQTDTAFRKLTTTLRTNNEFRKQLLQELDDVSGGALSSEVAGQQASEWMPRGLAGTLSGIGGVGGLATGIGLVPILKALAFTSPKLVSGFIYALGLGARQTDKIMKAIQSSGIFPGDIILKRAFQPKVKPPTGRTKVKVPSANFAPKVEPELAPLAEEAQKYKSAEEFVSNETKSVAEKAKADYPSFSKYDYEATSVPIKDIKQRETPNLTSEKFKEIKKSVSRGDRTPIVIDESGFILDGHHRFNAYVESGANYGEVPVLKVVGDGTGKIVKDKKLTDLWNKVMKK